MSDQKNGQPTQSQQSPKKKSTGSAKKKLPAYLPPALQDDGKLATALRSSKATVIQDQSLSQFWQHLRTELRRLRSHPKWKSLAPEPKVEAVQRIFRTILMENRQGVENARARLLRYLLACHEHITHSDDFRNQAFVEYREHRIGYNQILGDFIPTTVRTHAADLAYANNRNPTALEDWSVFLNHLEAVQQKPTLGLAMGLPALDQATAGLRGLTVLAGETTSGKSSLALQLAIGTLTENPTAAVLFYTLELTKDTYFTRLYSHFSGVPYRKVTQPGPQERKRLQKATQRLQTEILPRLRIVDWGSRQHDTPLTLDVMRSDVEEMWNRPGIERILVVVDPLQRWEVLDPATMSDDGARNNPPRPLTELEAEDLRVRTLMRLQALTRRPDVPEGDPILAVSGVRKVEHKRKRLTLGDVRGNYNTVCEAHCVLLLEPVAKSNTHTQDTVSVILSVKKVRDGGAQGDIPLQFHYTLTKFEQPGQGTQAKASPVSQAPPGKPTEPKPFDVK